MDPNNNRGDHGTPGDNHQPWPHLSDENELKLVSPMVKHQRRLIHISEYYENKELFRRLDNPDRRIHNPYRIPIIEQVAASENGPALTKLVIGTNKKGVKKHEEFLLFAVVPSYGEDFLYFFRMTMTEVQFERTTNRPGALRERIHPYDVFDRNKTHLFMPYARIGPKMFCRENKPTTTMLRALHHWIGNDIRVAQLRRYAKKVKAKEESEVKEAKEIKEDKEIEKDKKIKLDKELEEQMGDRKQKDHQTEEQKGGKRRENN